MSRVEPEAPAGRPGDAGRGVGAVDAVAARRHPGRGRVPGDRDARPAGRRRWSHARGRRQGAGRRAARAETCGGPRSPGRAAHGHERHQQHADTKGAHAAARGGTACARLRGDPGRHQCCAVPDQVSTKLLFLQTSWLTVGRSRSRMAAVDTPVAGRVTLARAGTWKTWSAAIRGCRTSRFVTAVQPGGVLSLARWSSSRVTRTGTGPGLLTRTGTVRQIPGSELVDAPGHRELKTVGPQRVPIGERVVRGGGLATGAVDGADGEPVATRPREVQVPGQRTGAREPGTVVGRAPKAHACPRMGPRRRVGHGRRGVGRYRCQDRGREQDAGRDPGRGVRRHGEDDEDAEQPQSGVPGGCRRLHGSSSLSERRPGWRSPRRDGRGWVPGSMRRPTPSGCQLAM